MELQPLTMTILLNIKVTRHYSDHWTAIHDSYDGPGSAMGHGRTRQEAIDDLLEQFQQEGK